MTASDDMVDVRSNLLRTTQLAEMLEIGDHTLRRIARDYGLGEEGGPGDDPRGHRYYWPLPAIHRLQVAAALETVVSDLVRGKGRSAFPALLEAVLAVQEDPTAPTWVVYRDGAVSYVWYPADVSRLVGSGAVVAKIEALWPERRTR
jgi:hypothetical protein